MAETLEKVNLGMAEFIAKLIDETMEAVIDSQMRQAENIAEIKSAAFLPLADYAEKVIADEDATENLKTIFEPNPAPQAGSTIDPAKVNDLLGIELNAQHLSFPKLTKAALSKTNLSASRPLPTLTTAGMRYILLAVKIQMAEKHHLILQLLAKDGIPRVVIDNGEINAKVSFTATSLENLTSSGSVKKSTGTAGSNWDKISGGTITTDVNGSTTLLKAEKMSGEYTRYMPAAKLVIENASQTTNSSSTNLFGEITVKFKTIY